MKGKLIFLVLFICIFLSGCAQWIYVEQGKFWKNRNFSVSLPEGWKRAGFNAPNNLLFLTNDGFLLEYIQISQLKMDKKLSKTKKKISDNMLLPEISRLIADEISQEEFRKNFKILSNIPTSIDTKDCFKINYSFHYKTNYKIKGILYGFVLKRKIYLIAYEAGERYYFDKYLPIFEKFIANLEILS